MDSHLVDSELEIQNLFFDQVSLQPARLEIVESMLQFGINIDAKNYALKNANDIRLIKLLIDYGADIHTDNDYTLFHAVRLNSVHGGIERVQLLLSYGADIHAQNERALRTACSRGDEKMVEYLLSQGAVARNNSAFSPMYFAVHGESESKTKIRIIEILLLHGAIITDIELLDACEYGRIELVKKLVELGADPTTDKIRSWISRKEKDVIHRDDKITIVYKFLTEQITQIEQKRRHEQIQASLIRYPYGLPTYPPPPVVGISPMRFH